MTGMSSPRTVIQNWAKSQLEIVNDFLSTISEQERAACWENMVNEAKLMEQEGIKNFLNMKSAMLEANISYSNTLRIRVYALGTEGEVMSNNVAESVADYYRLNRLNVTIFKSLMYALSNKISNENHAVGVSRDDLYAYFSVQNYGQYVTLLEVMSTIEVEVESLRTHLAQWDNLVTRLTSQEVAHRKQNEGDKGLAAKINSNREKPVDATAIEEQIQKWQVEIQNMLVARTWGWEVEAPNPGEDTTVPAGVERGSDGSVESYESDHDDCQCTCSDCRYHDCDCDDCDNQNDDPQHCGYDDCQSCSSYEFRTTGGIPRALHPGLRKLLEQISDTEKNETAGTHIHVYARDLEAYQIGVVLGGYALTQRVWDVLAGRDVENDSRCRQYADLIPGEYVSYALRRKALYHIGKFNAVNTHHVTTDRGTLEFRQMNCNFDFNRITFMGWMVRGLVEVAKRGATITEFFNIVDIEGFIKLYAKYGFTTFNETDVVDDPIGSRYNQSRNRVITA
jgi:hypothetical protein